MKTITSIDKMKKWSRLALSNNKSIGFVATMGCLHEGHLSLIKTSTAECDNTVVSIFVNQTQFSPEEDFDSYPRNIQSDKLILQTAGVDIMFNPNQKDLYPEEFQSFVTVEKKTNYLCGISRPRFFRGVTTVIIKLFNIINPNIAYFGEKDWQQLEVVRTMVRDLNMDVSIVGKPIVRDKDGLAMSSRNDNLSKSERLTALTLTQALESAQTLVTKGERSAENIRAKIRETVEKMQGTEIDYISVCNPENFKEQTEIYSRVLVALAVRVGTTRLIDNRIIEKN
ncbi:MAG TPA: pantoate--beta-alanine ligase [Nitrospinaceae bacterium]|jgi:pantoate--beta-alanine ligase|nr:pantoate--beta-alanine ligase [Nitrospinaceae bacterium]